MPYFFNDFSIGKISILFLTILSAASSSTAEVFTDKQRVDFVKKSIQLKCSLDDKSLIAITKIKDVEKCLVLDKDAETNSQSLIIKISCKKDEVLNIIHNNAIDKCQALAAKESEKKPATPAPAPGGSGGGSSGGSFGPGGGSFGPGGGSFGPGGGSDANSNKTLWCKPIPSISCSFPHWQYEMPKTPCDASHSGEVVAFGDEKLICSFGMTSGWDNLDKMAELIAKADPKKIKQMALVSKIKKYSWDRITDGPVLEQCPAELARPPECTQKSLGEVREGCYGKIKCVRMDGGPGKPAKAIASTPEEEKAYEAEQARRLEELIKGGAYK